MPVYDGKMSIVTMSRTEAGLGSADCSMTQGGNGWNVSADLRATQKSSCYPLTCSSPFIKV